MRILVAEDNALVRSSVAKFLEGHNHTIVECVNGLEAHIKLAGFDRFDAIISDLEMPQKNGLQLLTELKEGVFPHREGVRFVLITANANLDIKEAAELLGAQVLWKPFNLKDLLQAIEPPPQPIRVSEW